MYFLEFESYEQAIANAKTFHIEVTYTDDKKVCSPEMPVAVLKTVTDYIDLCEETRTAFYIWNHQSKTITVIPYHAVGSLRLVIA
jgi:hypothetical protein